jgi:hypothetical protein
VQLDYELPTSETIRQRLERDRRAIDALLARTSTDDLVLEQLPNGEQAWLRPCPEAADGPGYVLTDRGRRDLAMAALFGRPWPTVADWSV